MHPIVIVSFTPNHYQTDGYNSYFKGPHYVGAAMAFIGGVVYGWIQTRLSWVLDRKQRWTGRVQLLLIIWTTVALLTCILLMLHQYLKL